MSQTAADTGTRRRLSSPNPPWPLVEDLPFQMAGRRYEVTTVVHSSIIEAIRWAMPEVSFASALLGIGGLPAQVVIGVEGNHREAGGLLQPLQLIDEVGVCGCGYRARPPTIVLINPTMVIPFLITCWIQNTSVRSQVPRHEGVEMAIQASKWKGRVWCRSGLSDRPAPRERSAHPCSRVGEGMWVGTSPFELDWSIDALSEFRERPFLYRVPW